MSDARSYPQRPFLAVSAAIVRETLKEAVAREVREETGMTVEPVALAGFRETVVRDAQDRVERHFVILSFAARWRSGEPVLNEELSEAHWLEPPELAGLTTTPGLAEIVAAAFERLRESE
jgi:8-oxo-dGTP diphosphatase